MAPIPNSHSKRLHSSQLSVDKDPEVRHELDYIPFAKNRIDDRMTCSALKQTYIKGYRSIKLVIKKM
ncbi:hypothetical protein EDD11_006631 [Mortierella claussenii]|nr:hypothetical protein EDD11_006631 [Mortierella claussenii]